MLTNLPVDDGRDGDRRDLTRARPGQWRWVDAACLTLAVISRVRERVDENNKSFMTADGIARGHFG